MPECGCKILDNAGVAYKRIEYCPMHASAPDLRHALDESLKLQAHYAKLLNMWDGGARLIFENTEEWLARLKSKPPIPGFFFRS